MMDISGRMWWISLGECDGYIWENVMDISGRMWWIYLGECDGYLWENVMDISGRMWWIYLGECDGYLWENVMDISGRMCMRVCMCVNSCIINYVLVLWLYMYIILRVCMSVFVPVWQTALCSGKCLEFTQICAIQFFWTETEERKRRKLYTTPTEPPTQQANWLHSKASYHLDCWLWWGEPGDSWMNPGEMKNTGCLLCHWGPAQKWIYTNLFLEWEQIERKI